MHYVVEMDLIPMEMVGRRYPITRRHLITADSISSALLETDKRFTPGQDCVAIRILEIGNETD